MKSQKKILLELLEVICKRMVESENILTELDSCIGDGDCGSGIKLGFKTVNGKLPTFTDQTMGNILKKVGMTLTATIGGTSGALFGTGFMRLGKVIGDKEIVTNTDVIAALKNALEGMKIIGGDTKVGDKTLIDALEPAIDELSSYLIGGNDIVDAVEKATEAALKGSDSTINLIARKGRASYLGERSIGHRDAGSMAIYLIFDVVNNYFKGGFYNEENN